MVDVRRLGDSLSALSSMRQARRPSYRPLNNRSQETGRNSTPPASYSPSVGAQINVSERDNQNLDSIIEELASVRSSMTQARSLINQARQTASTALGSLSDRTGLSAQTNQLLNLARETLMSNRSLSAGTTQRYRPSFLTRGSIGAQVGEASRSETQLDLNSLQTGWDNGIGPNTEKIIDFSSDSGGDSFVLSESEAPGTPTVINKFNFDGTLAWSSQIGTGVANTRANGMTVGQDGSVFVFGATTESLNNQPVPDSKDWFLIKYNADGTKAWTKVWGSSLHTDSLFDAEVGSDGSVYLTGIRAGQARITKLNSGGGTLWTHEIAGNGEARGQRIVLGTDGSSYILGNSTGEISDGGNQIAAGDFVAKYDANGTRNWIAGLGGLGTDGQNIAVSESGKLIVQGVLDQRNVLLMLNADGTLSGSDTVGYSMGEGPYAAFTEGFTTQSGTSTRGWTGSGNTSSGNNFGWNSTTSVLGTSNPGAIGGIIARTAAVNYFADSTIGTVSAASNELKLAGNFRMDFGTLDGEIRLGYFNPNSGFGDFLGLRFREPLDGSNKVRASLVIGGVVSEQIIEVNQNTTLSFDLTWTGDSTGSGTFAGTIAGQSISGSGNAGTVSLSAFGLLSGGTTDRPTRQNEVSGNIFFDNLTYSQEIILPQAELTQNQKVMAMGPDGSYFLAEKFADRVIGSVNPEGGGEVVKGPTLITKFNSDGSEAWTTQLSAGGMETLSGIDVDAQGNVYAFGSSEGAVYDGKVLNGGRDAFVTKISSSGAKVSTELIGSTSDDASLFIDVVGEGRVNLAGKKGDGIFVAGIRPKSTITTVTTSVASGISSNVDLSTDDSISGLLSNLNSLEVAMTKMEQDIGKQLSKTNVMRSYSSRLLDSYSAASQVTNPAVGGSPQSRTAQSTPRSEPIQSLDLSRQRRGAFLQSFLGRRATARIG